MHQICSSMCWSITFLITKWKNILKTVAQTGKGTRGRIQQCNFLNRNSYQLLVITIDFLVSYIESIKCSFHYDWFQLDLWHICWDTTGFMQKTKLRWSKVVWRDLIFDKVIICWITYHLQIWKIHKTTF